MNFIEDIQKKIDDALNDFYESDEVILDYKKPKILIGVGLFCIICLVLIWIGFDMIFTSVDCSTLFNTQVTQNLVTGEITQKRICFPNEFGRYKIQIFIVTLIAGVLTGASPYLIKYLHRSDEEE